MNCPRCGAPSSVLETRTQDNGAIARRRECTLKHRFTTYEIHSVPYKRASAPKFIAQFMRTVKARVQMRQRDMLLYKRLHEGATKLATEFNISAKRVYAAARKGRKEWAAQQQAKSER